MISANSSALLSDLVQRDAELGNAILKLKQLAHAEDDDVRRARIGAQIRHLEDKRSEIEGERLALKATLSTMAPPSTEVVADLRQATAELGAQIAKAHTADAIVSAITTALTAWNAKKPG